uniref:Uncharacterized protein TCIL3000_11_12700 n=1 Tax=Trypanosoma congolense (strain IL3000) TaxID=1068625 RepID=G0V2A2_TRYCI|nr:unnamed protein product [Trypanosoma congolense IL3000]
MCTWVGIIVATSCSKKKKRFPLPPCLSQLCVFKTRKKVMNSRKTTIVANGSAGMVSRAGEGDWRSTMRTFREEVQRLRDENNALKAATTSLITISQKSAEKLDTVSEDNKMLQQSVLTLLEEERQMSSKMKKENESLLVKLKELEDRCVKGDKEISRLADLVDAERCRNNTVVGLFEQKLAEKEDEYQTELRLRDPKVEKLAKTLLEQSVQHQSELTEKDSLLEAERISWRLREEMYKKEIEQLNLREKHAQSTPRCSKRPNEVGITHEKPPLVPPVPVSTEEDAERGGLKKRRLEVIRQQRRMQDDSGSLTTLASMNKLKDLKESLRL